MVSSVSATPWRKCPQIRNSQGCGEDFRRVSAEQTVGILEAEAIDLESRLCQWEMG